MGSSRSHWEAVYTMKTETAVSWYQPHPTLSLKFITAAAGRAAQIVDVGGGASTLVDDLLAHGYEHVTVLDVAEAALAKVRARLGARAPLVSWIAADITQWTPPRRYDVWHDRAFFHFLTQPAQQASYLAALTAGTQPGSTVIMATFAPDGPDMCSGLPVQRYSPDRLAKRFGPAFALTNHVEESHRTPGGAEQRFSYAVLKRV